jgi:ethanolamine utilization protein EutN
MRIAEVVGKVTLNRCHDTFRGANLKLVIPLTVADLVADGPAGDETLVAWDQLGAGPGELIAMSEGPEAAQPFRPEIKPIDAYVAAILDDLNVETDLAKKIAES